MPILRFECGIGINWVDHPPVFLLSQTLFYHSLSPQTIFGVVWSMFWGKMSILTFSASTLDVSRHMFMGIIGEPDHLERFGCFLLSYVFIGSCYSYLQLVRLNKMDFNRSGAHYNPKFDYFLTLGNGKKWIPTTKEVPNHME